jgi:hypothetical protein
VYEKKRERERAREGANVCACVMNFVMVNEVAADLFWECVLVLIGIGHF